VSNQNGKKKKPATNHRAAQNRHHKIQRLLKLLLPSALSWCCRTLKNVEDSLVSNLGRHDEALAHLRRAAAAGDPYLVGLVANCLGSDRRDLGSARWRGRSRTPSPGHPSIMVNAPARGR
jgi:hypothetical protein